MIESVLLESFSEGEINEQNEFNEDINLKTQSEFVDI